MWRERLQWWLHPLRVIQQWSLASMAVWVSSTSIPGCGLLPPIPSGCLLTANSSPPHSLLSNPQVPALSPHVWWTHIPVWGTQGCGMDHLCRSHSVLSAIDRLFHPPPTASDTPPSVPTDFPIGEGASLDAGTSPLL